MRSPHSLVRYAVAVILSTLAATLPHTSVRAQQREAKRPTLNAGADTNNAAAYYLHAVSILDKNPRRPR